jgi:hypothetical protein
MKSFGKEWQTFSNKVGKRFRKGHDFFIVHHIAQTRTDT